MLVEEDVSKALECSMHWCNSDYIGSGVRQLQLPFSFPQGERYRNVDPDCLLPECLQSQKTDTGLKLSFQIKLCSQAAQLSGSCLQLYSQMPLCKTNCSFPTKLSPSHRQWHSCYRGLSPQALPDLLGQTQWKTDQGSKELARLKHPYVRKIPHTDLYFIKELTWQTRSNPQVPPLRHLLRWLSLPGFRPTEVQSLSILLPNSITHPRRPEMQLFPDATCILLFWSVSTQQGKAAFVMPTSLCY